METVIEVKHLKKYFKDVKAVDDISFQIEKGELFGFLGINGAGKSTTINMLCTLLAPTDGEARICGHMLGKENEQIRGKIGVVYQNDCLDNALSVKENLFIRGSLYEKNAERLKARILDVCDIMELGDVYGRRFAKLSGGQKRRCEIARALMNAPKILFLDEPTTGLDPAARKNVWGSVETLRKDMDMTVFLTTHYMEEAAKASKIVIIDDGHMREQGTPYALKEKYAKDKLILVPEETHREELLSGLGELAGEGSLFSHFYQKEEYVVVEVDKSLSALPLLERFETLLNGFELLQGSMDDVFLNVTGKALAEK
ncbi:MAG: ATP-binding cassette domain-containing protein [Ruminococcus sp.]|nr:ATP-binding cassette domain-containing protein [Ruminococcus sp.]